MGKITFTALEHHDQVFEFEQDKITIGRSEHCDFIIKGSIISRHQADVVRLPEGYVLRNLGVNPVYVNDKSVKYHILNDGDQIALGSRVYIVNLEIQPEEATVIIPSDRSATIISSQYPLLVVIKGPNPGTTHIIDKPRFVVGRGDNCDFILDEAHISREHFAIHQRASGCHLLRLTNKPSIKVNNQDVEECQLFDQDEICIYPITLRFESSLTRDQKNVIHNAPIFATDAHSLNTNDNATVFSSRVSKKEVGPRVVIQAKTGESKTYPLDKKRTLLGRSEHCDIALDGDPNISRQHVVIENKKGGYYVEALSKNPVLVNGKQLKKARIYQGDSLQLGNTLLAFLSERKADDNPRKNGISRALLLLVSIAALAMAGFLIKNYLWQPWQVKSQLLAADKQLRDGQNEQGLIALQTLHKQGLPLDSRRKATALMAKAIGNITQSHINKGDYGIAKNMLVDFLKKHGAEIESEDLWEQLNEIRYRQGRNHQQNNNEKLAMVEFLSIDSDSGFYSKAQKSISHIWLELQKKVALESQQKPQGIAILLATAEQLFEKKNYLTPRGNNAYSIYANILARDPDNAVAKARIESMKTYYHISGKKRCALGDPVTAEIYYRRFLIIEPDNEQILDLIASVDNCKNARPRKRPTPSTTVAVAHEKAIDTSPVQKNKNQNKRKEKVKQLLQKEGVESDWIVEYLFDEPGKKKNPAREGEPW